MPWWPFSGRKTKKRTVKRKKSSNHRAVTNHRVEQLNVEQFKRMMTGAVAAAQEHQQYVNSINVFPVADGDTGSNLVHTIHKLPEALTEGVSTWPEVKKIVTKTLLSNARGNTGIIVSQYFLGLVEKFDELQLLDANSFTKAIKQAEKSAYEAIDDPQKGTILDVFSGLTKGVSKASKTQNLVELLDSGLAEAQISLENTKNILPQNRKAQVVDSGGAGFLFMLGGMLEALKEERVVISEAHPGSAISIQEEEELAFRYCTECMLVNPTITRKELRKKLGGLGDSFHLIETEGLIKLHIHTNEPDTVKNICQEFGEVEDWKVDDMKVMQHDHLNRAHPPQSVPAFRASGKIAVVVDNTSDFPDDWKEQYPVEVVSLSSYLSDDTDNDLVQSLSVEEFFKRQRTDASFAPKTSQPNPQQFVEAFEKALATADTVFCLTISSALSGTYKSALRAKEILNDDRIHVVDTQSNSAGIALMVREIYRGVKKGKRNSQIAISLYELREKLNMFFLVDDLQYLRRGGRLSLVRSVIGNALSMQPVLTMRQGKIEPTKYRLVMGNADKQVNLFARLLRQQHEQKPLNEIFIGHALARGKAERLQLELEKQLGLKPEQIGIFQVNVVLGTHLGVGAIGLVYLR